MSGPFQATADGVRVRLRLTPRAARNAIEGVDRDAAGRWRLRVRVTAVAEKGRANAAMIKLLAKAWAVPAGSIRITAGATDRNKTVLVAGERGALHRRLENWLTTHFPARL